MKLALFDMDDTLFDFYGGLGRYMIDICSEEEIKEFEIDRAGTNLWKLWDITHMCNRMHVVMSQIGWWRNLDLKHLGLEIFSICKIIGFDIKILTKGPNTKPFAWSEKVESVQEHFPGIPMDIVGNGKGGTYGRVLVDDYPEYVLDWLAHRKRGLAILPKNPHNEGFVHPNAIIYDGKNRKEAEAALKAAFKRKRKQSWRDLI